MGGAVKKITGAFGDIVGGLLGIEEPKMPGKTEDQLKQEELAAEDARQQKMKSEREKIARQRGATGRQTLTYKGPQSVAVQNTKLGGGN